MAELEELTGRELRELDLHRPAVDEITFEEGRQDLARVPEVIDCWFDSGAMSYAQWHYPFENEDRFEKQFPGRLHLRGDRPDARLVLHACTPSPRWCPTASPTRTCICLSHIVDKDGKKMSKSLGNIIDPYDVFDTVGADALRWYFLARLSPDVQKRISVDIVADVASSFINTFWNTYGFFVLYARLDDVDLGRQIPRPRIVRRSTAGRWRCCTRRLRR